MRIVSVLCTGPAGNNYEVNASGDLGLEVYFQSGRISIIDADLKLKFPDEICCMANVPDSWAVFAEYDGTETSQL